MIIIIEYKYKHSKLKIIGSIGFAPCIICGMLYKFITNDTEGSITIVFLAIMFGVLMMVGLLNEM